MYIGLKSILAGIALACAGVAVGQTSLPTTVINGKEYYYYDVQPHETLFSVSRTLNIGRDVILESNPSARDGLKAYTRLYFPVEAGEIVATPENGRTVTHTVKRGETLYGISKRYDVSVDRLISLNPDARDGVRAGQVLVVSRAVYEPETAAGAQSPVVGQYVVKQGETLYRIASDNGLTVEALLAANPNVDPFNYEAGTVLNIPQRGTQVAVADAPVESLVAQAEAPTVEAVPVEVVEEPVMVEETEAAVQPAESMAAVSVPTADEHVTTPAAATTAAPAPSVAMAAATVDSPAQTAADDSELNVAIILPFMLGESEISRSSGLYLDFYRGFLMAADTLSHSGRPIHISVFDSANSVDTVAAIMQRPEMQAMNLIVTPDNEAQFAKILESASDDTFVLNLFLPKNSSYVDNANVIQANIPTSRMYDKVINAFMDGRGNRTPVFLSRVNGPADKSEFVSRLRERLDARDIKYEELTFSNVLDDSYLEALPADGSYVFIPVSGARAEFVKIAPALRQYSAVYGGADGATIWGYPEWTMFRGDLLTALHELGATIYTRFYNDEDYADNARVARRFNEWYGCDMRQSVPSQGILGFDTGCFVIESLRRNGGDFHTSEVRYNGLQSDFILNDVGIDGLVNDALLLINFRRSGIVESKNI